MQTINQYDSEGQQHGPWEENSCGKLLNKGEYVNGLEHGYWEYYWSDGQIMYKGNYNHGLSYGLWEYYRRDGILLNKGNFKNDQQVGLWYYYNYCSDLTEITFYAR
jgi:antitoxin component YwqK of YwqJK toxin-antitoxin module